MLTSPCSYRLRQLKTARKLLRDFNTAAKVELEQQVAAGQVAVQQLLQLRQDLDAAYACIRCAQCITCFTGVDCWSSDSSRASCWSSASSCTCSMVPWSCTLRQCALSTQNSGTRIAAVSADCVRPCLHVLCGMPAGVSSSSWQSTILTCTGSCNKSWQHQQTELPSAADFHFNATSQQLSVIEGSFDDPQQPFPSSAQSSTQCQLAWLVTIAA